MGFVGRPSRGARPCLLLGRSGGLGRLFLLVTGRFFPNVGPAVDVLFEPLHLDLELEEAVTQLRPAVPFARGDIEVGRHAIRLERAIHLHRLRHRHPRILLAHQEDRRRLHLGHVLQRRVVPVEIDRRVGAPRRAAKPRRAELAMIALRVHRNPVGRAGAAARRLETIGEGDDLVRHVAARTPAHLDEPVRVGQPHRDHRIGASFIINKLPP